VGKLKEAATYLDSQLREFDTELLNSRAELKESENKRYWDNNVCTNFIFTI